VRILYAVHRYPPHIGGSEVVSQRVVEYLVGRGHEVTVATGHHPDRVSGAGPRIEQFRLARGDLWPDVKPSRRTEADRYRALFASEWDARILYTAQNWHLDLVWDLVGTSPARDILAPVGFSLLGNPGAREYFELMEELLPKFHRVVYHSDTYQDYGFARDRGLLGNAVVIPNGTDLPALPESVWDKHARPGARLVSVASHVRSKGHADFFSACRRTRLGGTLVAPRPVSTVERFRGCYHQCRARLAFARNVEMIDGHDRHAVESIVADAQLFFLPSKIETAPLVLLEAMARATPWVSYDVGMVKALPGGVVVRDLGAAVDTLVELAADPARRMALAEAGRAEIAERYEWSLVLPEYARLVESPS
jgi:glycosyltransferase involved in cell wall biosynthesis